MLELEEKVLERMEKINEGWTMVISVKSRESSIVACSVCKNGCKGSCKTACSNNIKGKRGS